LGLGFLLESPQLSANYLFNQNNSLKVFPRSTSPFSYLLYLISYISSLISYLSLHHKPVVAEGADVEAALGVYGAVRRHLGKYLSYTGRNSKAMAGKTAG